jgi:two-component system, NarL family, response regulator DevR
MTTLQLDGYAGDGAPQQQSPQRIRVLICDDHELVRLGIRRLLETEADLDVVADVADASSALIAVAEHSPEVVVLDVRMPGVSGVEACREIRSRFPATRVLMLTSFADDDALFASIMAGASGYVLKQIRGGDLVNGVREVAAGNSLLDPSVTERVLARLRGETVDAADVINDLTSQERKILVLVADGLTNREIAARVFLAEKTVKNYVSHILAKLGVARRSEVAPFLTRRERAHGADSS